MQRPTLDELCGAPAHAVEENAEAERDGPIDAATRAPVEAPRVTRSPLAAYAASSASLPRTLGPRGSARRPNDDPAAMNDGTIGAASKMDLSEFHSMEGLGALEVTENAPAAPAGEGARVDDLQRLVRLADTTARIIPVLLAVFVVLGTVAAIFVLFEGHSRDRAHVTLEFLASPNTPPSTLSSTTDARGSSRLVIDTKPAGLFILHGQRILCTSPCATSVNIVLADEVDVRLSGPDFKPWVGHVVRDRQGAFVIRTTLESSR